MGNTKSSEHKTMYEHIANFVSLIRKIESSNWKMLGNMNTFHESEHETEMNG